MNRVANLFSGVRMASMSGTISLFFVLMGLSFMTQAQITTTLGTVSGCPGQTVLVPVSVTNFSNVGAASMIMNYDTSVLTPVPQGPNTIWVQNNAITTGTFIPNAYVGPTGQGVVAIGFFITMGAYNIPDGLLFNLTFTYKNQPGYTTLAWDLSNSQNCSYSDPNFIPLPASWFNGSAYTLPSIAANPQNTTIVPGGNGSFSVTAMGTVDYQWQVSTAVPANWTNLTNTAPYSGVNTASLQITGATLGMTGYKYRCIVTATAGGCPPPYNTATSLSATLTVSVPCPLPFLLTGGGNYCIGSGGSVVGLENSEIGVNYQLKYNNNPIGATVPGTGSAISFGPQTSLGNYTASGTNACGTTQMPNSVTIGTWSLPTATIGILGGPANICPGEVVNLSFLMTGAKPFTVVYTDGTTNYQTVVNANSTLVAVYPTVTSTYTLVSIQDIHCTGTTSGSAPVTVKPAPNAIASNNGPMCSGGTLNLTSSGGIAYQWSGPNGFTASISNPSISAVTVANAGIYTVTVTGANACTDTAQTNVTIYPPLPAAAGNITGPSSVCMLQSATYTVPPIADADTYVWSLPAGVSIVNGAGSNTVELLFGSSSVSGVITVYGQNGCGNGPVSPDFSVTVNNLPNAMANSNSPVCEGSTISLTSGGGATFAWSGPAGFNSTLQHPSRSNATLDMAGTYTVTVTSGLGCSSAATTDVVVNPKPTATAGNNSPICTGQNLLLNAGGGATYSWSGPNLFTSTLQNPVIPAVNIGAAGTYTVTVTNSQNCSATATTTVTINMGPAANVTSNSPLCPGETLNLSATGGTAYLWSGPSGFYSSSATPSIPNVTLANGGIYSVTVTGNNNCTTVATAGVIIKNAPNVIIGSNSPVCEGGTLNLTASGGNTYLWSGPNGFGSSEQNPAITGITLAGAGDYTVQVTGLNGCSSIAATTVVVNDNPVADAGEDQIIPPASSTQLDGSATGGSGNYTYAWEPSELLENNTLPNPFTVALTADQTFTLVVTDATTACVSAEDQVNITIGGEPLSVEVFGAPLEICIGNSSNLYTYVTGGTGIYTYSWTSDPAGFVSTEAEPTVTPLETTTYTCTVNDGVSTVSGSVTITVYQLPQVFEVAGGGIFCPGEPGNTVTLDNSQSGYTYNVILDGNILDYQISAGGPMVFGPYNSVGVYTITAVSPNNCSSEMNGSATIIMAEVPVVDAGIDQTIPYNTAALLIGYVSGGSGSYAYSWAPAELVIDPNGLSTYTFNLTATQQFSFEVTDAETGCTSEPDYVTVNVWPPLTLSASATPEVVCPGGNVQLNAYPAGGSGNYTYTWTSDPAGFSSTEQNPVANPLVSTTYLVVVDDGNGNTAATAFVTVIGDPEIYTVTGGGSYCEGGQGVAVGLSNSQEGFEYQLSLNGVPVLVLGGTGSALDFGYQTAAGTYTVNALTLCGEYPMEGNAIVTMLPIPVVFNLSGGGLYCPGGDPLSVMLDGSETGVTYELYLDNVATGNILAGDGLPLSWAGLTQAGIYTVFATNGCGSILMNGTPSITSENPPTIFNVTGGGSFCENVASNAVVGLDGSDEGLSYELYLDGIATGNIVAGTGNAIDFGVQAAAGTYTVMVTTPCGLTEWMSGSAAIIYNPLPLVYNVTGGGSACVLEGFNVGLDNSQENASYAVYLDDIPTGVTANGTGSALDFGYFTLPGTYTVMATINLTACSGWMNGNATITQLPLPYIISNPSGVLVAEGGNASFTVVADNVTDYQWQESTDGGATWNDITDGGIYAGTGTATLNLSGVTAGMDGYLYHCLLWAGSCTDVSASALLDVYTPSAEIITSLDNIEACPGTVVVPIHVENFYEVAAISLALEYNTSVLDFTGFQNLNANINDPSQVTVNAYGGKVYISHFTLTPSTIGTGDLMELVFTFNGGFSNLGWDLLTPEACAYSDINGENYPAVFINGSVSQSGVAPVIVTQPADVTVNEGDDAVFTIEANGANNYQWQQLISGTWTDLIETPPYSGTQTADLYITGVTLDMHGNEYRCVVGEEICQITVNSEAASLFVNPVIQGIITTAGNGLGCAGNQVIVPIDLNNLENIAAISLTLNYDPAVVEYVGYEDLNPTFNALDVTIYNIPGTWAFSWYSLTPINISSGGLLNLVFNYLGGYTALSWDLTTPGACEYNDFNGNVLPAVFINGSVGPLPNQPEIVTQPTNQTVTDGDDATFSVVANNAAFYQWQISTDGGISWGDLSEGAPYSGVNTANLLVSPATILMDGHIFRVHIQGENCEVTSGEATLFVEPYVAEITTYAGNATACNGTSVVVPITGEYIYNVAAISLTLTYDPAVATYTGYTNLNPQFALGDINIYDLPGEWRLSWFSLVPVNIGSGKLLDLTFDYISGYTDLVWDLATPGNCEYDDFNGNILPANFINGSIGPDPAQPVITGQPADQTVIDGTDATFTVTDINGTAYQWQVSVNGGTTWTDLADGGEYSGTTTPSLLISPSAIVMDGWLFRVIIYGGDCYVVSDPAILNVEPYIATINTIVPDVVGCPGNEVIVPVTGQYIYNVAAISLTLNYDPAVLTYTGYTDLHPQLTLGDYFIFDIPGTWKLSWYSLSPVNVGIVNLLNLHFDYHGGFTALTWDVTTPGNCEYNDFDGNILPANFIDGSVGPNGAIAVIMAQPGDLTVNHHDDAQFHVTADLASAYQWQVSTDNGTTWTDLVADAHYSGVNTPDLYITNAIYLFNGYMYRCAVTGDICITYSDPATLTVIPLDPFVIITTATSLTACPGSDIVVPINVNDFYNVASISLTMDYDDAVLTYNGFQNLNPGLMGGLVSPTPGQFKFSWYSLAPLSLGDATIVELLFTYNGGTTPLTWDVVTPGFCEYGDFDGNTMPALFIDGTVSTAEETPVITSNPVNVVSYNTTNVSFSITADLASSYQWQVSDDGGLTWTDLSEAGPYSGVYTETLYITGISMDMNGNLYRCYVNGTCGHFAISESASLTVVVQPTLITTAGEVTVCGNDALVPVTAEDFYDVISFELILNYDATIMSFTGLQNINPGFVDFPVSATEPVPGEIHITGMTNTTPLTLSTGILFDLGFNSVNGGTSALSWDPASAYINSYNLEIPEQFNNGSVTININPFVFTVSGGGGYCIGGDGVTINLSGSENGVNYELYHNGLPTTYVLAGTGNPLDFTMITEAGTYTVVATNALTACVSDMYGSAEVIIYDLPVVFNVVGGGNYCEGGQGVIVGLDGSQNGISYELLINGLYSGNIIGDNGLPIDFGYQTQPGIYTVYGIDNTTGCISMMFGQVEVGIWPLPEVTFLPAGPFCVNGEPGILSGTPEGGVFSGPGVSGNMFYPATAGVGTWTLTYTYTDENGCVNSATTEVIVHPLPELTFDQIGPFCVDAEPAVLTAYPAGGTFSGTGVSGNMFDPAAAGVGTWEITYTYTDENGCTTSTSIMIVVNPLPELVFDPAGPFCVDADPFELTATPAGGTFSGPGVTGNMFDPSVTGAGTWTLTYTYTDENTCTNFTTIEVIVNPLPVVIFDPAGPFCVDADPAVLSGSPVGGIFSGTGVDQGMFYPAVAGVGTWTLTYTYTDENGCVNSATIEVIINPLPELTFDQIGPFCVDAEPAVLTAYPAGGTFSGPGVTGNMFDPAAAGAGTWEVFYTYTDENGCTNSTSIMIVVNPLPVVSFDPAGPFCVDADPYELTAYPVGGTFSGPGVTGNMFDPSVAGAGIWTLTYTYTDENSCTNFATIEVIVNPLPVVIFDPAGPFCVDADPAILTGSPVGGTFSGTGVDQGMFYPAVAGVGTWTLTYTYTDENACTNFATIEVIVNPLPEVTFEAFGPVCVNAEPVILSGIPAGGTFSGPGVDLGMFYPATAGVGTWTLTYTYTDENGCTNFATTEVTVLPLTEITVNPADAELDEYGNTFFHVEAINATAYQWQLSTDGGIAWVDLIDDMMYTGTATNHLMIAGVTLDMNGYLYRAIASGLCEPAAVSAAAMLTVNPIIITIAGDVETCASDQIIVPVSVIHMYGVAAMSLSLNYDDSQLTYVGYQDVNPELFSGFLEVDAYNSQVKIGYFSITPANIGNGLVLNLVFSSTGGYSDLIWDSLTVGNCEYQNLDGDFITSHYVNGSALIHALPVLTFDQIGPFCVDADPALLVAYPDGGIFSGTGVVGNMFYPGIAGVGTWEVTYTYTDEFGCTNSTSIMIVVNPLPVLIFDPAGPFCVDADPYELIAYPAGGTFSGPGVTANMFYPSVAGAGTHLLTYTYTDENGCTNVTSILVTVNPLPVVSFDPAGPFCVDADPAVLTGSPAGGIFSGTGVDQGMFYPAIAGVGTWTLTYTYTDENGCVNSASIEVIVNPLPVLTFDQIGPFCVDADPVLLVAYPAGGTFSGPGVVGGMFYPNIAGVGTWEITYTYTDENGCTNSTSIMIVVNPLPVVSFDPAGPFCVDADPYELTAYPAGGTFSGPGVTGNMFYPAVAGAGTHVLTYTYTDGNGCTNFATIEVIVNPLPIVIFDPVGPFCVDADPVVLNVSPLGGTFSGNGIIGNEFYPSIAGIGVWTLIYTYIDENGCVNSASIEVTVNPLPDVYTVYGGGEYCAGGNGLVVGMNGSQLGVNYHLYLNGVNTGQVVAGTGSIIAFGPQFGAGTYTVQAVIAATGCSQWMNSSASVVINPLPQIYAGGYQIICQGQSTTINAAITSGTPPYSFTWTPATGLNNINILNPVANPSVTTFYTVVVTDVKGCTDSDNALIVVNPAPVVSAGPDKTINAGMSVTLDATASGVHPPFSYVWTPTTGLNDPTLLVPVASPIVTTTYTLLVTDALGCTASDAVTITVSPIALGYNVTGLVTYYNSIASPMTSTEVYLKSNSVLLATTLTNNVGQYGFSIIPNGIYSVTGGSNKPWGGGNSIDALLMARHFQNLQPLSGLFLQAGDLDGNGVVNANDALLVMMRSVHLINSFPVGDWIVETKPALVNNGDVTVDLKSLCYGDVNGSHVPAAKFGSSVSLNMSGSMFVDNLNHIEIPVNAGRDMVAGAASLVIDYPSDVLDILSVNSVSGDETNQFVYTLEDGKLYIEWYCLGDVNLKAGETMFVITAKARNFAGLEHIEFTIGGFSQIGDPNANIIPDARITMPNLKLLPVGHFSLSGNYPNPFSQATLLNYSIPENATVTIRVYNLLGEMVATVVDAAQTSGNYTVTFDGSTLPQGVYTCRMNAVSTGQSYEQTIRMVIAR